MSRIVDIKAVPKVNLGVRLEGATTPETYLELAAKNKKELPFEEVEDGYKYLQFQNLPHFHSILKELVVAVAKESDFHILIDRFAEQQASHNVTYCEFFISMSLHVQNGLNPWGIAMEVNNACRDAEMRHGIKLRCIPMLSKDCQGNAVMTSLSATVQHRSEYIIGLGLEGAESKDIRNSIGDFQIAGHVGLALTAHVGEWRDTKIIWDAINHLNIERITSGVSIMSDDSLVEFLETTQVPISICPSTAYQLNLFSTEDVHPIFKMIEAGLNVSVNSDSPLFLETSLIKEYRRLTKRGLTNDQLIWLLENAINSSFMSIAEKKVHLDQLQAYLSS